MLKKLILMMLCVLTSNVVMGAEPILRSMTTDGKKMLIYYDVEGTGDVNEGKILKALDHIDASIDTSKKKTKEEKSGRMTVELPAKTPPFTMTHWETRSFSVIEGKLTERCARTYFFAFDEEQEKQKGGVPISIGDFKNFVRQSVGSSEEIRGEKIGDKCIQIELQFTK